jgi:hypothetical protein
VIGGKSGVHQVTRSLTGRPKGWVVTRDLELVNFTSRYTLELGS